MGYSSHIDVSGGKGRQDKSNGPIPLAVAPVSNGRGYSIWA